MCEKESVENWFGSFCPQCRQIKNNHKRSKSVDDESYIDKPTTTSRRATRSSSAAKEV